MKRARTAVALMGVLVVAGVMTESAFAHLPGRTFCSAKQPAKVELKCGKRAFYHGLGATVSLRQQLFRGFEIEGARAAAHRSLRDHRWLMKAGKRWIAEARARLAATACGASAAACAWYADGDAQCEVAHEGGFTTNTGNGYYGRFQMDLGFQQSTDFGRHAFAVYGTADRWPEGVQIEHAYEVWTVRGWRPWPPYSVFGCAYWKGKVYRG